MTARRALIIFLVNLFIMGGATAQQESFLPQVADGNQIKTTFVLFNPTTTAITVTMTLADDHGDPLALDLADLGTKSQFVIELDPGATRILQTNGTGDGAPGAARLTATGTIGVSAIFSLFDGAGTFLTETGIGDSNPATDFLLPVDVAEDFNTGVAIFNDGDQKAELTLTLLNSSGAEVASTEVEVATGGHLARFVAGATEFFPEIAQLQGTLRVSSSQPVAALTLRQNAARLNLTSLPVVEQDSTQKEFILPHVADGPFPGGAIKMTFLLFNTSDQTATIQLSLTDDNGEPFQATIDGETASDFNLQLSPGAARFLETDGSGGAASALTTGAALVTSDQPIGVSGIFTLVDSQGRFLTETGIGHSAVLEASTVAVDEFGSTGVALFNPGDQVEELTLTLLDSDGSVIAGVPGQQLRNNGAKNLSLGPKEHRAFFVEELFQKAEIGRASVAIQGRAALLTLRQITEPRLSFTAYPVAEGAATSPADPASVVWNFCESAAPLWLAYQNDEGPWVELAAAPGTSVPIPIEFRGGVAFVKQLGSEFFSQFSLTIYFGTAEELQQVGDDWCLSACGGLAVMGSVTGLAPEDQGMISLARSFAAVLPQQLQNSPASSHQDFDLLRLPNGTFDLVASRQDFPETDESGNIINSPVADKLIIRRGLQVAEGLNLNQLDFNSSEAFDPVTAEVAIKNVNGEQLRTGMVNYLTSNSTTAFLSGTEPLAFNSQRFAGVPDDQQQPGELHELTVGSTNEAQDSDRWATKFFRKVEDLEANLGPSLAVPDIETVGTSPYARFRVTMSGQPEYNDAIQLTFNEGPIPGGSNAVLITASAGYFGGAPSIWKLTIPELTDAGFDPAWGMQANNVFGGLPVPIIWGVFAFGIEQEGSPALPTFEPVDGAVVLTGLRAGAIDP